MAGVLRNHLTRHAITRIRSQLALATLAIALSAVLGACSENLDGGAACATLCPGSNLESRELTLTPITQENVVSSFVENGSEVLLPLIDRKDTVQTRLVARFDTLLTQYRDSVTDSLFTIDTITDASLLLTIDRTLSTVQDSVFLEVFDINDAGDDTTATGIESRLVPARRIGTRRMAKGELDPTLGDTIQVPLDAQRIQAILRKPTDAERRVRLAVKVSSPRSVLLRVFGTISTNPGPVLRYKAPRSKSTAAMAAHSESPAGNSAAQDDLADFVTVPVRAPQRTDAVMAVGGLPSRRTVLRFTIPDSIDRAAAILQAELRLVQLPDPLRALTDTVVKDTTVGPVRRLDSLIVAPLIGIGGEALTADPRRAAQLARRSLSTDNFSLPTLRLAPNDSGVRTFDVSGLLRRWSLQRTGDPRYIVLATESEGVQAATAYFGSSAASDPSLRPVLYIRYIPRVGYGIP